MCDTIYRYNLTGYERPTVVFKVVTRLRSGRYITPVMCKTMYTGVWQKAPKSICRKGNDVNIANTFNFPQGVAPLEDNTFLFSSEHVGMWSAFAEQNTAFNNDLVNNVKKNGRILPKVVVMCEPRGVIHQARWLRSPTYLCKELLIMKEVGRVKK